MRGKIFCLTLSALGVFLGAQSGVAGLLSVPHRSQDKVIVHTYPAKFAHPVDYWWHLDPSTSGAWDYFSTVPDTEQPIAVEQGAPGTQPLVVFPGLQMLRFRPTYATPSVTGSPLVYGIGKE